MAEDYGWERVEYFRFDSEASEQAAVTRQMSLGEGVAKVDNMFGINTAAQDLYDSGLIFLVNQSVLHHFGYALGVDVTVDGTVTALVLFRGNDPDGIVFDEATMLAGREKLLRMMQDFARRQVTAREEDIDDMREDPILGSP